jgi:hypothetical protein
MDTFAFPTVATTKDTPRSAHRFNHVWVVRRRAAVGKKVSG